MIIIPIKWLFHWEYTLFSDKPIETWGFDIGLRLVNHRIEWVLGLWDVSNRSIWVNFITTEACSPEPWKSWEM